jgi:hypothetical protein
MVLKDLFLKSFILPSPINKLNRRYSINSFKTNNTKNGVVLSLGLNEEHGMLPGEGLIHFERIQIHLVRLELRFGQVRFGPLRGQLGVVDRSRSAHREVAPSTQVAQVVRQTLHLVIGQIVVVVDGTVPCGLGHAHRTTVRLQVEVLGGRIRDDAVHASPRRRIADRRVFLEEEPGVVGLPHQDHRERCVGPVGDGGARALDRRRLLLLDLVDRALPVVVDPGGEGVVARDERAQFLDGDRLELLDGGERRLLRVLEGEGGVVCGGGEVFGGGDGDHDWGFQGFRGGHGGAHHHAGLVGDQRQVGDRVVHPVGLAVDLQQEVLCDDFVHPSDGVHFDALGQATRGQLRVLLHLEVPPFVRRQDYDQHLEPPVLPEELPQTNFSERHRAPLQRNCEPHSVVRGFMHQLQQK